MLFVLASLPLGFNNIQQQKQTHKNIRLSHNKVKKRPNSLNIRPIKILQRTNLSKILFYATLVM